MTLFEDDVRDIPLTPPDVSKATDAARACANCDFYSFKTWDGDTLFDGSTGKCFRDLNESCGRTYYVAGNQLCPAWKLECLWDDDGALIQGELLT